VVWWHDHKGGLFDWSSFTFGGSSSGIWILLFLATSFSMEVIRRRDQWCLPKRRKRRLFCNRPRYTSQKPILWCHHAILQHQAWSDGHFKLCVDNLILIKSERCLAWLKVKWINYTAVFFFQLSLMGPPGPLGLTGRPGPLVRHLSDWDWIYTTPHWVVQHLT